jgi:pilus assembly protein TadC
MGFFEQLASSQPDLKRRLIMAKMEPDPVKYVQMSFQGSIMVAASLALAYFLFASPFGLPFYLIIPIFLISWWIFYKLLVQRVDIKIKKIAKDIDREVLFAGRFLLVKLNAGRPLITALTEASQSYGVATKYFKEIVMDIDMGTPLEEALAKASRYSPSDKFRRILFQITNALKIGVDVTNFLEAILDEIAAEQLLEIQRYGKKLNSLTMFYMLFSIVIPSLGITLFVTIISMMNANFDLSFFLFIAFMLCVLEFFFITIFKQIRPTMNI